VASVEYSHEAATNGQWVHKRFLQYVVDQEVVVTGYDAFIHTILFGSRSIRNLLRMAREMEQKSVTRLSVFDEILNLRQYVCTRWHESGLHSCAIKHDYDIFILISVLVNYQLPKSLDITMGTC
jgi:hypothetical protein